MGNFHNRNAFALRRNLRPSPWAAKRRWGVGQYIAHTRRKIKPKKDAAPQIDADLHEAREKEIAARREEMRAELERARAAKAARTLLRAVNKRQSLAPLDMSGRRRTAVRAAGIALISATGGLRTQSIGIFRLPGSAGSDLWAADVKFDIDRGFTYYINDPAAPAEYDALHAMRALAPRVAEQLFMGDALDGPDDNNLRTAHKLADSYMRKAHYTSSMNETEKQNLVFSIFEEFHRTTALRLDYLRPKLAEIVESLMRKTKLTRSDCNAALGEIYDGYEEYLRGEQDAARSRFAWAPPPRLENKKAAGAA
jgi:hypothetical protein